jgi:pimeloyl-ACP methyl ester carboxylesterase
MLRLIRRLLSFCLMLIVIAVLVGWIYQAVCSTKGRREYPPPGQLIDVGGYHMHLFCIGKGTPTVVLHWPYSLAWYSVQPEIAKFTRVCAVDPAGVGWSESGPASRDSNQIAIELNQVLTRGNVQPPYVVVTHSRGAFYLRVFAARFQSEIAGIVLVEPEHEDTFTRIPESNLSWSTRTLLHLGPLLTRIGVVRIGRMCGAHTWMEDHRVPSLIEQESVALECQPSFIQAEADHQWQQERSAEEARSSGALGSIPLTVISRDPSYYPSHDPQSMKASDAHIEAVWSELQQEQLKLSSDSSQIIAFGAGHGIPWQRPDVVTEAARAMVQIARAKSTVN